MVLYLLPIHPPPTSTLFPYTTLFRSGADRSAIGGVMGTAGGAPAGAGRRATVAAVDRKSTRLNSSHVKISYAVFCLKKKIAWTRYFVLEHPPYFGVIFPERYLLPSCL